jgi:hypothetical protein
MADLVRINKPDPFPHNSESRLDGYHNKGFPWFLGYLTMILNGDISFFVLKIQYFDKDSAYAGAFGKNLPLTTFAGGKYLFSVRTKL